MLKKLRDHFKMAGELVDGVLVKLKIDDDQDDGDFSKV